MSTIDLHRTLRFLLALVTDAATLLALPEYTVSGIEHDSRQVRPGNIFVALAGGQSDGHQFIPQAVERGAVAIVGVRPDITISVPYIQVADSRAALATLAAGFFNFPARQLTVIGVTGTDGKTTTSNLIYSILRSAGIAAGMITTVNAVIGDQLLDTGFHVTTPEAQEIQSYLDQMVNAGLTHVVLEATSHGLAQHRVDHCEFDVGLVTNITHEHLDYHGSYQAYRSAKGKLFLGLADTAPKRFNPPRAGVLNIDDASYEYIAQITKVQQLSYGLRVSADITAEEVEYLSDGLQFLAVGRDLHGKRIKSPIFSPLLGDFNLSNCLAAIAVTLGVLEIDLQAVQQGLAEMRGVPGRMERISLPEADQTSLEITAIVDFAHTPNALKCALETAHRLTQGKVIAVFGSAGLRDRMKRRLMASVSAELADLTILTGEDPRSESLDDILAEMATGMEEKGGIEGKTFWRVPDRGEALRFAVQLARSGDLVIACGKGHEQSMCFGSTEYPWDDRAALRSALAERYGIRGYQMPYLPTQPNQPLPEG